MTDRRPEPSHHDPTAIQLAIYRELADQGDLLRELVAALRGGDQAAAGEPVDELQQIALTEPKVKPVKRTPRKTAAPTPEPEESQ